MSPRPEARRPPSRRSSPSGCAGRSGPRRPPVNPSARATCWMRAMSSSAASSAAARPFMDDHGLLALEAAGNEERPVAVPLEEGDELALRDAREAPSDSRSCSRSGGGSAAPRRPSSDSGTCSSASWRPEARSRPHRRRRRRRQEGSGCRTRPRTRASARSRVPHPRGSSPESRRDVTGDAARKRELPEELPQTLLVARHMWVDLGVRAFEVRVRDEARASVTRCP